MNLNQVDKLVGQQVIVTDNYGHQTTGRLALITKHDGHLVLDTGDEYILVGPWESAVGLVHPDKRVADNG